MATTIPMPQSLFLLLLIARIISSCSTLASATSGAPKPPRISMKLIHRNSVLSPHYNPNATVWELNQEAVDRSRARVRFFQDRMAAIRKNGGLVVEKDDLSPGLVADNAGLAFLAKVSIGKPPVAQLLNVDTGSSLSWVRCAPCNGCPKQEAQLFDPSKSSTYADIPCSAGSSICGNSSGKCTQGKCTFTIQYADGTVTRGNIGSEQLLFETTDEGTAPVNIHTFGCAHTTTGPTDYQESGLLGLGISEYSLLKQLGGKFSHCLGNIHDPKYEYNMLVVGEGAIFEGDVTPIFAKLQTYYVTLEGISVGEEKLDINPSVFKLQGSGEGGVIIDTGSTLTTIAKGGYEPLLKKVQSLLDKTLTWTMYSRDPEMLCYKGQVDRDLSGFPAVSFHFTQGTDIVLDIHSMFVQVEQDTLCMTVVPSGEKMIDLSIIGNMALQSYNIGYDINAGKMYVQRIDCQLLQS